MRLIPSSQTPNLSLPLTAGGSTDDLSLGSGVDGRFTLVLFFRGLHCPVCRKQLSEVERRLDEIHSAGVGRVVAVSMESAERSAELVESWHLERLPVAYGMREESARQWGLFISTSIKDGELPRFNEPGMFVRSQPVLEQRRHHALRPSGPGRRSWWVAFRAGQRLPRPRRGLRNHARCSGRRRLHVGEPDRLGSRDCMTD